MEKLSKRERLAETLRNKRRQRIFLCLAVFCTLCIFVIAFTVVIPHYADIAAIRREMAMLLREDVKLHEINPDYAGWLEVGDLFKFPVVRGEDNEKYLDISFTGELNKFGAIFMDYRNIGAFEENPHVIIFGHGYTRGESYYNEEENRVGGRYVMFGGLKYYLYDEFLEQNQIITFREGDKVYKFDVFSARLTDIHDPAYFLDFSEPGSFRAFAERCDAPPDAAQILTLSTCYSGDDDDERIIVQAALR
jgi:sortase B